MERLPAGWRSIDAASGDVEEASADGDGDGDGVNDAVIEPTAFGTAHGSLPTGGSGSGRRSLAGLAGLAVAAALAVLASATPQPVVLIGDQQAGVFLEGGVPAATGTPGGRPSRPAVSEAPQIVVDVGGAVARPGVYRLRAGSRAADALREAGGFSPAVDVTAVERTLNLAAPLADGTKVHVPSLGDVASSRAGGAPSGGSTGGALSSPGGVGLGGGTALLDLNRATADELDGLPGIGPVTAAKIIAAREQAPFVSVDELDDRGVVGPSVLAKIRELVTVGP
ncbi:MAG: ComEA family DNA-binding protein [Chloroflexi bacterium]|nr:ComEA family DNA-binding protein [Chloroflexota bacterium]